MSHRSRRKKVRIIIEPRDRRDGNLSLGPLQHAAQGPDSKFSETTQEFLRPVPDEQLETELSSRAGQRLDSLDRSAQAANVAAGHPPDAIALSTPEELASRRRRVWERIFRFTAAWYRLTIEAVVRAYIKD